MIFVLPFKFLATAFAIIYILILIAYLSCSNVDLNSVTDLIIVFFKCLSYHGMLIFIIMLSWKYFWRLAPILNKWVFPDLNGVWHIDIHWNDGVNSGVAKGAAIINQSLVKMSMEISTKTSESETLMVKPLRHNESDRPSLFYIYRNTPKTLTDSNPGSYLGTAILNLSLHNENELSGNYFTERNTQGHFRLIRKVNRN